MGNYGNLLGNTDLFAFHSSTPAIPAPLCVLLLSFLQMNCLISQIAAQRHQGRVLGHSPVLLDIRAWGSSVCFCPAGLEYMLKGRKELLLAQIQCVCNSICLSSEVCVVSVDACKTLELQTWISMYRRKRKPKSSTRIFVKSEVQ